jgi:hypothetical protein
MRCGNWKTPDEISVGQAVVGVAEVLAEVVLVEEVLDAASVGSVFEAELLDEGPPRAVQLKPPVLSVITWQLVVLGLASVKMS